MQLRSGARECRRPRGLYVITRARTLLAEARDVAEKISDRGPRLRTTGAGHRY
jgi:hypothetical protein